MLNYFNFYCINNNIFAAENHQFNFKQNSRSRKAGLNRVGKNLNLTYKK
jgi:hypothetical protein